MSMGLATVEVIKLVVHHPNADKLDIVRILGYDAIVGRDQYKEGDLVVFVQPDSILPADAAWAQEYLRYTSKGRLRAVRLRGEWSMGLVLDMHSLWDGWNVINPPTEYNEGDDVTELLGISKYEPKLPGNVQAKGGLPFQIPKTDEDRWQNLRDLEMLYGQEVDVTLKMDGSSATYYCVLDGHWPGVDETVVGLTSRSLELKNEPVRLDDFKNGSSAINSKWHEAERRYDILNRLKAYCQENNVSLALRGEITGAGIQAFAHNPHANGPTDFHLFDVYNITEKEYETRGMRYYYRNVAKEMGLPEVQLTEMSGVILSPYLVKLYDSELKKLADGNSFEGVVVKHAGGSFKIINKWYDSEKE